MDVKSNEYFWHFRRNHETFANQIKRGIVEKMISNTGMFERNLRLSAVSDSETSKAKESFARH